MFTLNHQRRSHPLLNLGLGLGPSSLVLLIAFASQASGYPDSTLSACLLVAVVALLVNKPPVKVSLLLLWSVGMVFLAWHLFTLVPLPVDILGMPRIEFFREADLRLAELAVITDGASVLAQSDSGLIGEPTDQAIRRNRTYGRLTLNQSGTRRFILLFAGGWSMFWLSAAMSLSHRRLFMGILVTGGAFLAVLILLFGSLTTSSFQDLLAVMKEPSGGLTPNRHHFAFFCALLTPSALSLLIAPVPLFYCPRSGCARWRLAYGCCLLVLALVPVVVFSRESIAMMLLGCAVVFSCLVNWRWLPTRLSGLAVMLGLMFAVLLWPSFNRPGEEVEAGWSSSWSTERSWLKGKAMDQWRDFPLCGAGADSFRTLNSQYRLAGPTAQSYIYSRNQYSQWLADHGLFGLILLASLMVVLLLAVYEDFDIRRRRTRSWRFLNGAWSNDPILARHQRELYLPVVSLPILAAVGGTVAGLLLHLNFDFTGRFPLNVLVVASLLGLTLPLPHTASRERAGYWRWPLLIFVVLSLLLVLCWSGDKLRLDQSDFLSGAGLANLSSSVAAAPAYWRAWTELAVKTGEMALEQRREPALPDGSQVDSGRLHLYSVVASRRAVKLNPTNPLLWRRLGRVKVMTNE